MHHITRKNLSNPVTKLVVVFLFFNLSLITLNANAKDTQKTFSFGIVPQQSAMILAKRWMPILKALEEETGFKFVFRTNKTIPKFEKALAQKVYDFAYMNPYHYTVFHKISDYQAFAKQGNKLLTGIIVAHKDSPIQSLQDLQSQTIAFPAPAAFAATVIPQAILKEMGIRFQSKYVSSHESVYKNVSYKSFVAGGGIERTFNNTNQNITQSLKVIWKSKGYTPHAFAGSPNVSQEDRLKVQQALIKLSNTSEGRALLKQIKFESIVPAKNQDWDDVRSLDINLLANLKPVSTSL